MRSLPANPVLFAGPTGSNLMLGQKEQSSFIVPHNYGAGRGLSTGREIFLT
jgi:hypothetical protein